jgi:hypothetical protein
LLDEKAVQQPKNDGLQPDWQPSSDEIATALTAKRALSKLWRRVLAQFLR